MYNYQCIYNQDNCIKCDICNVLELEPFPKALGDELSGLSGNDIELYEHIRKDEIFDVLAKIWNLSKEELSRFLKGGYTEKVNNKPIKLAHIYKIRNPINITIGFQDEPAGDEADEIQNMGIMKIEMPKYEYETLFVISSIVFLDLLAILDFNGIEMVSE